MADGIVNMGLSEKELAILRHILSRYPHIEEAVVFGSRAKGNYKPASDIDLAIKGKDLEKDDLSAVLADLEASLLPYFVDVVLYRCIQNEALKEHIDRVGRTIYRRDK